MHKSPQSSLTGCAKLAEGRKETSGRLLLSFLNLFSKFPDKQTDKCGTKGTQKTLEAKTAAFIPILTNMCDDGETVSGTKIERQRDEKTRRGEGGVGGKEAVGGVGAEAITSPLQWLTLTTPPPAPSLQSLPLTNTWLQRLSLLFL